MSDLRAMLEQFESNPNPNVGLTVESNMWFGGKHFHTRYVAHSLLQFTREIEGLNRSPVDGGTVEVSAVRNGCTVVFNRGTETSEVWVTVGGIKVTVGELLIALEGLQEPSNKRRRLN